MRGFLDLVLSSLYMFGCVSLKHLPDDMVHETGSGEESFLMFQSCDILN
jgi:hypothetical protein